MPWQRLRWERCGRRGAVRTPGAGALLTPRSPVFAHCFGSLRITDYRLPTTGYGLPTLVAYRRARTLAVMIAPKEAALMAGPWPKRRA